MGRKTYGGKKKSQKLRTTVYLTKEKWKLAQCSSTSVKNFVRFVHFWLKWHYLQHKQFYNKFNKQWVILYNPEYRVELKEQPGLQWCCFALCTSLQHVIDLYRSPVLQTYIIVLTIISCNTWTVLSSHEDLFFFCAYLLLIFSLNSYSVEVQYTRALTD